MNRLLALGLMFIIASPSFGDSQDDTKETKEVKVEKKEHIYGDPNRIRFGVKAGLSFSNAALDPVADTSGRTGFIFGVTAESPLLPGFLMFQPEFNFVQKGAENNHFGAVVPVRMNYLELPLQLKVKFSFPRIRPYALAGPSLSYLLNASGENAGTTVTTASFSTFDISMYFGAGLHFQLTEFPDSPEATFGLRYGTGLMDVDPSNGSWKSSSFQLTLGIQY